LIIDGHDVRGFHMTVCETFAVKVCKGIQSSIEHVTCFRWRQRPVWKNL